MIPSQQSLVEPSPDLLLQTYCSTTSDLHLSTPDLYLSTPDLLLQATDLSVQAYYSTYIQAGKSTAIPKTDLKNNRGNKSPQMTVEWRSR